MSDTTALRARLQLEADRLPDRYVDAKQAMREAIAALALLQRPALSDEPVDWKGSYHQACDDADAYKAEAEKRILKAEQNWRSVQYDLKYMTAVRDDLKSQIAALRARPALSDEVLRAMAKLAKEAVNGWACYAKRKSEHSEIARLHSAIDAVLASQQEQT